MKSSFQLLVAACALCAGAVQAAGVCKAESATTLTPVIELYTSEGCSSCPPADKWLSTLKPSVEKGQAVVEAFHVGYWDYIGWVDRFAAASHTTRQREVAKNNSLGNIYTPQLVRNGMDSRDFSASAVSGQEAARARIALTRGEGDSFEAMVTPAEGIGGWSAYWSVTENGHTSKVKAGENAGELLAHDFVVRQYVPAGDYKGPAKLVFRALPAQAGHARQVNLVVFEPRTGKPLQAISLGC